MTHTDHTPKLFTFGFERSGTTLLSMLLGAHPELAVPFSPVGLWYRYWERLPAYGDISDAGNRRKLLEDLAAEDRIRMWDYRVQAGSVEEGLQGASFPDIVEAFHARYAALASKRLWVLHDIANLYYMDVANRWFPSARFLHLVRDVRDVALSHKGYRYGSGNVCEVAARWREDVGGNLKMGSMLGQDRYLVIRYEDLVTDPEGTLKRCCAFAEIDYSDSMLNYRAEVDKKVPADKRSLWPTLGDGVGRSAVGRWRERLGAREVMAIEEIAEPVMRRLDYDAPLAKSRSLGKELFMVRSLLLRGGRGGRLLRKLGARRR